MKCLDCKDYLGNICQKAQNGRISEMEDVGCLLKCQLSLLRSIWEEIVDMNTNKEGDEWKFF